MSDNPLLTPEDHAALDDLKLRLRKVRVRTQLRDGAKLRPWMQLFAYWYAFAPKHSVTECRIKARELAHDDVSSVDVATLRRRPDFQELVEKFQTGGVEGALAKLKADLPFYVDSHRKGLEMAMAAEDYGVVPKYTLHALEIVSPRRNDLMQQNLQVNVLLSPKQLALEATESVEVTVAPIVPDKL